MLNTVRLAFIGALMMLPQTTFAADKAANPCVDIAVPKDAVMARHGNWMELTPEQWQFLRGVYVLDPQTPPGLPYGDKAVLAQIDGRPGGLVLFIDGDKACTPIADSRRASFRDARRRDRQDQSPGNRIIGSPGGPMCVSAICAHGSMAPAIRWPALSRALMVR